jgi:hypothetical protein
VSGGSWKRTVLAAESVQYSSVATARENVVQIDAVRYAGIEAISEGERAQRYIVGKRRR